MKQLGLAALLVILTASTSSMAQPPGGGRGPESGSEAMVERILSFDDNEDGKITKDEVPERLQSMFSRADKNKDGQLTKEEIQADLQNREGGRGGREGQGRRGGDGEGRREGNPGGRPPEGGRGGGFGGPPPQGGGREGMGGFGGGGRMPPFPVMAVLDADQNGEISAEEIKNAAAALKSLDRNNDGKLGPEELRPEGRGEGGFGGRGRGEGGFGGRPPEGGRGEGGFGGRPPEGGRGEGGRGGGPEGMIQFLLGRFDENQDGKLSKDEAPDRMRNDFDRVDSNGDGFADKKELEQMAQQFQGRGGRGGRPGEGGGRPPEDGGRRGGAGGGGGGERRRPPVEE